MSSICQKLISKSVSRPFLFSTKKFEYEYKYVFSFSHPLQNGCQNVIGHNVIQLLLSVTGNLIGDE